MRILLLNNPKSGRGAGSEIAANLGARLTAAGHTVTSLSANGDHGANSLRAALGAGELLVIAGGDGTLHYSLPAIMDSGVAFYHFPLGTENLFTREFGMDRRPETLLRSIEGGKFRCCDAGLCNGRPFAIMTSVGFDACVVERVAAGRRGGVTRAAYVRHAVQELLSPRVPKVTLRIDGQTVVDSQPGLLVIANSRQYAARLDPARDADMSDGLLDAVFLPHSTAIGLARWLLATAAGKHAGMRGVVTGRGRHIQVELDGPWPHQIDGEAAGPVSADPRGKHALDIHVAPGVLRVLSP